MSSELSREEIELHRAWHAQLAHPTKSAGGRQFNALCDMAESWRAHCEAGRVSVPKGPTAEMRQAGVDAWAMKDSHAYESVADRIYRAMLSAAPAPAAQDVPTDASEPRK